MPADTGGAWWPLAIVHTHTHTHKNTLNKYAASADAHVFPHSKKNYRSRVVVTGGRTAEASGIKKGATCFTLPLTIHRLQWSSAVHKPPETGARCDRCLLLLPNPSPTDSPIEWSSAVHKSSIEWSSAVHKPPVEWSSAVHKTPMQWSSAVHKTPRGMVVTGTQSLGRPIAAEHLDKQASSVLQQNEKQKQGSPPIRVLVKGNLLPQTLSRSHGGGTLGEGGLVGGVWKITRRVTGNSLLVLVIPGGVNVGSPPLQSRKIGAK